MLNDSSKSVSDTHTEAMRPVDSKTVMQPNGKFPAVPWGPWVAVLYALLVYFAAQIIAGLVMYAFPELKGWTARQTQNWLDTAQIQFIYYLLAESITFAATWWFIRLRKGTLRMIGWRTLRWQDLVSSIGGFAFYFVVYLVVANLVTALIPSLDANQKQQLGFDSNQQGVGLLLTFLSLVVLPPLVEETVFRGFIFTGILGRVKPVGAALITSVIFAAAHLQFGSGAPLLWVAAIDTFILSLVLCYLRYKTDSLWPGIIVHALKNSIAFIGLFIIHQ